MLGIYFPLLPMCSVVLVAEVIDDVNYNDVHHPSTSVVGGRFVGVPGVDHLLLAEFACAFLLKMFPIHNS